MENSCSKPWEDPEHQRLVMQKVREEDRREALATDDSRLISRDLLNRLGYAEDEIEVDAGFEVSTGSHSSRCVADYLVRIHGRPFMAIKCTMALESRQRHIVSLARVADEHVIPFAMVTDGMEMHLTETISGKTLSRLPGEMPSRDFALEYLKQNPPASYPDEKREREKRVLLAFETIACPKPEE